MKTTRIDFLGLPLDVDLTMDGICNLLHEKGELRLIAYITPASWVVAERYPDFLGAMKQMTVIRAGGEGVARVCRWLTGYDCQRINFDMTSMADHFFKLAAREKASVFLVGGKPGVAEFMEQKLRSTYADLNIIDTQHGYGDFAPKIEAILKCAPDAVIVAMGSPAQEKFLLALRDAGYKGMAITCGGFFDQYLESADYYPQWINRWNLRFAYRLFKEPRRLWRRYLIDYQSFIWNAVVALTRKWLVKFHLISKKPAASGEQQ